MSLHPAILADLLDMEVRQARELLGDRAHDLRREGESLLMTFVRPDGSWTLRLDGTRYDAEPFDVALIDAAGAILPLEQWIPGFALGVHTSLGVPWVCADGTRGYYSYEGHHEERWDAIRYAKRAGSLLDHLLRKAGL
jgi:hypothetical protein